MRRTVRMMAVAYAFPSLAFAFLIATAPPAQAQPGAVVQQIPSAAAVETLNQNLARLSRSPQDVEALLGAGQAALDLGDVQAANGFFTRANSVNPALGRAKLGLAVVQLALKQADQAAASFDAADQLGEHAVGRLADRGLAYDLTGQQAKAQRDYVAALRANPNDSKARLRYAVSLGISGRLADADAQLMPLLSASDREAWRLRAFIYAMNGHQGEARRITQSVMPKGLSDALDPYMARASLLTPAQKAAAAHYGDFPANVLRLAAPTPTNDTQLAKAAEREPARKDEKKDDRKDRAGTRNGRNTRETAEPVQVAEAAPASVPALQQSLMPPGPPPPPPPSEQASADPAVLSPRTTVTTSTSRQPQIASSATRSSPVLAAPIESRSGSGLGPADPRGAAPAFSAPGSSAPASSGMSAPARVVTRTPTFVPAPAAPASETPSASAGQRSALAAALASLDVPAGERQPSAAGVDLGSVARIQEDRRKSEAEKAKEAAKAKAKAEALAKAKAEAEEKARIKANPSRIWVQIAAGKNVNALAFDLRRFRQRYADALGDEAGWSADWGQTNRLLVGPFKKAESAKEVVAKIAKAGGDAFVWLSEGGEEVTKIGAK